MEKKQKIESQITAFVNKYTKININGVVINCPYWSNKIRQGKVLIRGFLDGKGKAHLICHRLIKKLVRAPPAKMKDIDYLRKFAKRERIGIDCSGFAYNLLAELVRLRYKGCKLTSLSSVFPGGINKTNVKILTNLKATIPIKRISDFQLGDLIRMMGGRHVAVILAVRGKDIIYAHSSNITQIPGVHSSIIKIIDKEKFLDQQLWLERTQKGENFGTKYFLTKKDGVYRLKIFS